MLRTCFFLCIVFKFTPSETQDPNCNEGWNYSDQGPPEWPSICETCAGQRQSPIAIWANRISYEPDMTHLQLRNYNHEIAGITITDNGHTAFIQLPANNTAHMFIPTKPNVSYKVQQVHFHWGFKSNEGSEHTIGNDKFPIEIHLVHKAEDETLAVIAVFGQITCDHGTHVLREITKALSNARETGATATLNGQFFLSDFLPHNRNNFFTYSGSLTTPPCSEIVEWVMMADPIHIKPHTIHKLRGLRDPAHHTIHQNYRPTQGLYGRVVKYRGTGLPRYNFTSLDSCDYV